MTRGVRQEIERFLRSPRVIVGELAALAIAGVLGAIWPDGHVFRSAWFAALALLAVASLCLVVLGQFRRRRLGALVLHAGILLAIVAGALRALFATEAVVDLVEGETLPPTAAAWSGQFPGLFAAPFHLDQPVTLEAVSGCRYDDGDLRDLRVRLSVGEVAVNGQLRLAGNRVYLGREFGPVALLEWSSGKGEAVLLDTDTREGLSTGPAGLRAYLRANASRSTSVAVRVMRGGGLIAAGDLRVGEKLPLPGGAGLTLRAAPMWARLHGSRDPALWLVYLGFALVFVGAVMIFMLKPVTVRRFTPVLATSALVLLAATSCRAKAKADARQLVARYNEVVAEAYRRGDVKLVDPVVGPNEGKKLTGLIGVRLDMGLTLDSQLLALEVTDVERATDVMRVKTLERWQYRDRKIGTGEPVGEESVDSYEMLYVFKRIDKAWVVDEIQFSAPPQVGRKTLTWAADRPQPQQP